MKEYLKMTERKVAKNQHKSTFINIPRSWTYLIGYEYQTINQHGEPKLTKGQKPVIKRIDHADLLLLDEIRGFSERGNKECFEEAVALAQAVGMIGQEKQLCDKVLQLCGLGFVKAIRKTDEGKMIPKVVLKVDTEFVNDAAEARKEWILEQQRMDSQTLKFGDILAKTHMLQEYLQEYIQEQLQEQLPEYPPEYMPEQLQESLQEDSQDDLSEYLPEYSQEDLDYLHKELPEPLQDDSQEHLQEELQRSTDTSKHDDDFPFDDPEDEYWPDIDETILSQNGSAISDQHINESSISCFDGSPVSRNADITNADGIYAKYYILDGKTDEEIIAECRRRIRKLSDTLKEKFDDLIGDTIYHWRKCNSHISEDVSKALSDATKENLGKKDIDNLVKIVNYVSNHYLSDKHLQNYANGDLQLKTMATKEYVDHLYDVPF